MGRIVFPLVFANGVTLFGLVDAKNTSDGATSILIPYLAQQPIDMAKDRAAVKKANDFDISFNAATKLAEKLHEQCVVKLNPIIKDHRMMCQNLKRFYNKTPHVLGDYGIVLVKNRIVYPSDRDALCASIKALIDFSNSLPAGTSPITAAFLTENDIDIVANLTALPGIIDLNKKFKAAVTLKEKQREKRDTGMAPVLTHLRGIGSFLVNQFTKTPKTAGDWGYVIDNSPKAAKFKKVKMGVGKSKILYSVVAQSIIQITGLATLTITKGAAGTGTPIVLKTGDVWQVAKGYSILTISSSDLLQTGGLTYMKS